MVEYKTKKEEKSASKITKIGLGLFALVFVIAYFVGGESEVSDGITAEDYWEIEEGMSYKEVVDILKEEGEILTTDRDTPEREKITYTWDSSLGGSVTIVFVNDSVTYKREDELTKRNE